METRYELNDQFWINALVDADKKEEVIRLFYTHAINPSAVSEGMSLEVLEDAQVCEIILKILERTSCKEIISILQKDAKPFSIGRADICQFSSFDDCYYKVIDLAIRSRIEGISYDKMGFLLRTSPRNIGADKKYGENHGKMAVQMGLCSLDAKHLFWPTALGICFNQLPLDTRKSIIPQICLYIPIIQNYFVCGMDDELLESYFSLLAPTTQKRRRPNVSFVINCVKNCIL